MIRDHRNEILRTVLGALGAGAVLAVAGWPQDLVGAILTLLGAIAGVVLAFLVERLADREGDLAAVRQRVRELEQAAEHHVAEREHLEYRLAVAQREAAVNANAVEVWGGMHSEAIKSGQIASLDVLLVRLAMTSKAKGLDIPIPKPGAHTGATAAQSAAHPPHGL